MEGDRRRHTRSSSGLVAHVELAGAPLAIARLLDVSPGGAMLEMSPGAPRAGSGARALTRLVRGDRVVMRGARVVRLRWSGRERGRPVPPAVALVFDDGDTAAALRLAELLVG
jgi:hypothetical protein